MFCNEMGVKCAEFFVLCVCSFYINVTSYPIEETENQNEIVLKPVVSKWHQILALAFTLTCVLVLFGCLNCCKQRAGFKEFRNSTSESNTNNVVLDFVNPLQNVQPSRYSIFSSIVDTTIEKQPDSVVTFEPLPKILPKFSNLRLPQFNDNSNGFGFIEDWLGDKDFPRQQLHYLRECGQGWFGKVVEGEARGILSSSNKVYSVVVKILKEDATAAEQAFFLQEAKPYKVLSHPNVLKLLGRCLENVPFLLVFESCLNGDLKSYLKQNVGNRDALIFQGVILRMSVDVACGLSYMLQHGFIHTDVAARNCLVTSDLRVKVGDYGTSIQSNKDEYYVSGDIALPIRWCAPETLNCSNTVIESKPICAASCIWSYAVLLWELEEWGELPYKDLTNDQVIIKVFGEGLRLPCPVHKTPYTQEIYNIMQECWKDYVDRPSFIHVINTLSALMHRLKNNDFDSRWHLLKPNTIPARDNEEKLSSSRIASLSSKSDNDSGIDLDNPKILRGLSVLQLQQTSSRQRLMNDECSESPASSRRFSNSSTGDIFSSPLSMKHRSPSLENLHGSLDNIDNFSNRHIFGEDSFNGSSDFGWLKDQSYNPRPDSDNKVNFQLGNDTSILWNDKPLFQIDSYLEDNLLTKRADSLSTDAEEEIWRKRIERGEFTEKVKEKSKSVADLMILTHIECSESSESDSLPSFHSRQSSFNRQSRRMLTKNNAPVSLLNSLSFGSESNLPAVEKDPEFQDALKKIQIAKINKDEDSLHFVSLQANSLVIGRDNKEGKTGHFLANDASENRLHSSHINCIFCNSIGIAKTKLPLFDSSSFESCSNVKCISRIVSTKYDEMHCGINSSSENIAGSPKELPKLQGVNKNSGQIKSFTIAGKLNNILVDSTDFDELHEDVPSNFVQKVIYSSGDSVSTEKVDILNSVKPVHSTTLNEELVSLTFDVSSSFLNSKEKSVLMSSLGSGNADSVIIGASENDTLELFKGLKTTLAEEKSEKGLESCEGFESPRTLNDFLHDLGEDFFYKYVGDEIIRNRDQIEHRVYREAYCDYCYAKCHFSNECIRCRDGSLEENCSCESFENLEKFRDCTVLNSCPFQSDDSGRGTDQINSGDGSSDKSLEGSISMQMNEVKNRLEDVIAKFTIAGELSDDNCSSLEDDKDVRYLEESALDNDITGNEKTALNEFQYKEKLCVKNNVQLIPEEVKTLDVCDNKHSNLNIFLEEINNSCDEKLNKVVCTSIREVHDGKITESVRCDSLLAISEENENSASLEEDTCIGSGVSSLFYGKWSEDEDLKSDLKDEEDKSNGSAHTFVKVEQLFFTVDPKFEKEIEAELSKSPDPFTKCDASVNDINDNVMQNVKTDAIECISNMIEMSENANLSAPENNASQVADNEGLRPQSSALSIVQRSIKRNVVSEINLEHEIVDSDDASSLNEERIEYDVSDILEGLSEPISLPYSVNQRFKENKVSDNDDETNEFSNYENDYICNSWLPSPIEEHDYKRSMEMDEICVEAIRNELREKLPYSSTLATIEPEEQNSTENTSITIEYNTYSAQLSPILEEEEDYSSLSSMRSVLFSSESESSETINVDGFEGDDVLLVNTETNEASILEQSKTFSSPSFNKRHKLNETYEIDENDDTIGFTDTLDSDSFPSPNSLSPGTSSKTGAQLSYSSSECGNLSDVFLSPSSSKNFDELDLDKSGENNKHLNTPENTLQSCRNDYQKAVLNIDEMLKKSEFTVDHSNSANNTPVNHFSDLFDPERRNRDETWLKSFFRPVNDTASLVDFDSSNVIEKEFRSLPADFKSENWPLVDKLMSDSERNNSIEKDTDVVAPVTSVLHEFKEELILEIVVPEEEYSNLSENLQVNPSLVEEKTYAEESLLAISNANKIERKINCESTSSSSQNDKMNENTKKDIIIKSENNFLSVWSNSVSHTAKQKNSIALFGNTSKQIRNFYVSVVEDDSYLHKIKSSPTMPKSIDTFLTERLGNSMSAQSSEKTWKSQFNSAFGLQEINVNDMLMSTSFIESNSQDGSVDGKDENLSKSDNSDDEGVESTSDDFVWKNNNPISDIAQCNDKKTEIDKKKYDDEDDDEDDDDDEELTDFVPFSWNSGAAPQRSALKNKDTVKINKKNVSFKKQKYHCVYEYPKEESNYPRNYETLVPKHVLNFLNFNQEYFYNDYTSFSDWELDDCDEPSTCSDDFLPYPGKSSITSRSNLSNKLGFYTIGTYDIDANPKEENSPSSYVISNSVSSPMTSYSGTNSSTLCPTYVIPDDGEKNPSNADSSTVDSLTSNIREFTFDNLEALGGEKSLHDGELEDVLSPGLGELRHTKCRLKLDLSNKAAPASSKMHSTNEKCLSSKCESRDNEINSKNESKNGVLPSAEEFVNDYGLNYKSCDISPVVELKSLTSTSVA